MNRLLFILFTVALLTVACEPKESSTYLNEGDCVIHKLTGDTLIVVEDWSHTQVKARDKDYDIDIFHVNEFRKLPPPRVDTVTVHLDTLNWTGNKNGIIQ